MSRAYRVRVRESVKRNVKSDDKVETKIELLEILPKGCMEEMLADELEKEGYKKEGKNSVKVEDGVKVTVNRETGDVSITSEKEQNVEVSGQLDGSAYDDDGQGAAATRRKLSERLKQNLDKQIDEKKAELQKEVTDQLEGKLCDVREGLDRAVNKVTAEALKQKAASMGQIKECHEEENGDMTIVLEV